MKELINKIAQLKKSPVSKIITKRLKEFKNLGKQGNNEWFSELCFCLLTANSRAKTAISIQQELAHQGFQCKPQDKLSECIKRNRHRFHNNKASFIVEARKNNKIKDILKKQPNPREWLVKNIKGLGWKESSHFLRNVGYTDYAIIDRHVLNILMGNSIIEKKPLTLNKNNYMEIEQTLAVIAKRLEMSQAELDLYLWYMKTGEVLK